jgi:uncharacterized damage-inducible protein DinB
MDVADFRVLYDFNAWANRRILEACSGLTSDQFLKDMQSSFPSIRDTLAHIYGAEFVWLERWNRHIPVALPTGADFPDFASIRARLTEMDAALVAYVSLLDEQALSQTLDYKLFSGKAYSGPLSPMLQHVANHSTYHRGQVITMLRQLGAKGVSTDLIAYHRELAAQGAA